MYVCVYVFKCFWGPWNLLARAQIMIASGEKVGAWSEDAMNV